MSIYEFNIANNGRIKRHTETHQLQPKLINAFMFILLSMLVGKYLSSTSLSNG
jgi:hypothetical protein